MLIVRVRFIPLFEHSDEVQQSLMVQLIKALPTYVIEVISLHRLNYGCSVFLLV